jgi:transcription elongation GreA/GreB family factor
LADRYLLATDRQTVLTPAVDKVALLHAIIAQLEAELALQTEAAHASHDEATDEESRAEDKYDMRSQSAAYLAAGQSKLATEIAAAIAAYRLLSPCVVPPNEPIAVGAVVTLAARGRGTRWFLGPLRGGMEVVVNGVAVTVITAVSPVGRQLVGRRVGDHVLLPGRLKPAEHQVLAVE